MKSILKTVQRVCYSQKPEIYGGLKALKKEDPELHDLVVNEQYRQWSELELIASENFTSSAVLDCLGSCLTNKYSEGQPGARYYGGNTYIDEIENLCKERALKAFGLSSDEWYVNVQAYSGSPANVAVYCGVLEPNDRILGLHLPSGGHLTHGAYRFDKATQKYKHLSVSSLFFNCLPYSVNDEGYINYDEMEEYANLFLPRILVAGGSAYPRDWDYERMRDIADQVGAYLMMDMSHFAGLVASGEHNNPFDYCDIVTTTTHKTLRGPRGAMIFSRLDKDISKKIDDAVFPGLQGGPHNNVIAAIATQMKEVASPKFKEYAKQVKANAKALSGYLMKKGYSMMTGGTDNHLMLWDLRPLGLTGSKCSEYFEFCNITLNKNTVAGDKNALSPGGVRIGTPALTSRGFKESDFEQVGEFLHQGVQNSLRIQSDIREKEGKCTLKMFKAGVEKDAETKDLAEKIASFSREFPFPGLGEKY